MADAELSVSQAVAQLAALLDPVTACETVPVADAVDRVLAAPVHARVDQPAFDNAAMDGYALRAADLGEPQLQSCGRSYAGHGFGGSLQPGQCVRIMTGAPLPDGADTVVMIEDVRVDGSTVQVLKAPAAGANVRRRGEHLRAATPLLAPGRVLDAVACALAAGAGVAQVEVRRRLRVGLASTGDELADAPTPLPPAGTYDANRPLLLMSLRQLGFDATDLGICADEGAAFAALLQRAFDLELDVLLTSGGAAQGDADVVRQAGGIRFLALDIRPGRGLAYAVLHRADRRLVLLGLPGNVVAAYVMFHLVARPALRHLASACGPALPRLWLPLAQAAETRGGRIDWRRARIVAQDGGARVELLAEQGSAMLRTVAEADALVAIGPAARVPAGTPVEVIPLAML